MAVKIQLRRDLAANWGSSTVLASGEVGYETDTGNIKIGDGTTQWGSLAYYQLPNVSVDPAISGNTDLNDADYRVMGRYRLNSVTGGSTFTNVPSDFAATVDADSVSTLIVTSHAYPSVSPTMIQQLLTQFSASGTDLKQWVRLYNGTNYTAWTSTAHLSDSEVTTAKIADSAVTTVKIADANVTTAKILDANVTTAKIADSNVTTAKVADSAVTTAKIADSSSNSTGVTNAKIRHSGALSVIGRTANSTGAPADISATAASGAVLRESGSTIGFGTIATAGIADSAVTTAKIANDAVTAAKLAATAAMPYPIGSTAGVGQMVVKSKSGAPGSVSTLSIGAASQTWAYWGIPLSGGTGIELAGFVGVVTSATNISTLSTSQDLMVIAIRLA